MESILEKLKCQCMRDSTARNYLGVWRQFNKFMTKLNSKPNSWEQQASLFGAYLVDNGVQSSTLKSYISAIKITLTLDGYHWTDEKVLLGTLMKACQIMNDQIQTRLPIHRNLLEILLFELERIYTDQPYLEILYKDLFILAYYGLFRVGELTQGPHTI